jgi:hypothetical protein
MIRRIMNDLKESTGKVSEVAFDDQSMTNIPSVEFDLPNGVIEVGNERFSVPERCLTLFISLCDLLNIFVQVSSVRKDCLISQTSLEKAILLAYIRWRFRVQRSATSIYRKNCSTTSLSVVVARSSLVLQIDFSVRFLLSPLFQNLE